jgi:hypothetical protein
MIRLTFRAALGLAALVSSIACAGHPAPSPSKITTAYQGKVDDATREAASVLLVTTSDIVIAQDCNKLAPGTSARLPANVTIYTTPFEPVTLDSLPDIVTDDGYGGKLCTPHSFTIVKQP